jgi:4-diphosphocytidyl-2-C-methyl-D-erythritol kinase
MQDVKLKSSAKINLHLQVLGKSQNNYHFINTLVAKLELCDAITIAPNGKSADDITFTGDFAIGIDQQNNTVKKAMQLLRARFSKMNDIFYDIVVAKNIPSLAGLGGGSGNGAEVYNYFANHFDGEAGLNAAELCKIGMDCNLFGTKSSICYAANFGDKVAHDADFITEENLLKLKNLLGDIDVFLFLPKNYTKLSTAQSYSDLNLLTIPVPQKQNYPQILNLAIQKSKDGKDLINFFATNKLIDNSFFANVKKQCLEVCSLSQFLSLNSIASGMSGAGPCLFALCQANLYTLQDFADCSDDFKIIQTKFYNRPVF